MGSHHFYGQIQQSDVAGLSAALASKAAVGALDIGILRAALATRDSGPRLLVYAGSSTTVGNNATTASRRYVNILTKYIQDAYPLRSGGASPPMRSLADAYADRASLTAGVQGVNAGVGGTTAANYLTQTAIDQIGALQPVLIMHMVGSNDYAAGVNPDTYKQNLFDKIAALDIACDNGGGGPRVHVLVQPYQRTDVTSPEYSWASYGQAMAEIAEVNPGQVIYLDISAPYAAAGVPGADPFDLLDTDNIHQTDAGHALMADLLRNELGVAVVVSLGGDSIAPSIPTGLAATAGDQQVSLSWNPSSDNIGVAGYNVYRDGALVGSPAGTAYIDTGLTNNTSYTYTVSAFDAAGNESSQSTSVSATPEVSSDTTPPSVPTDLAATPGNVEVSLSWTASTDNVGVAGYRVYRDGALVASPTETSHVDTGLTNGVTYSYTVSAFDAALNESAQSAPVTATPDAGAATPVVLDTFDRPDSDTTMGTASDTGQTWEPVSGTWGIQSQRAYTTSTSSVTTLIESGVNDIDVACTINIASTGSLPGLIFRALDGDNRMGIFIDIPNDRVELWKNENSSGATRITDSAATMTLDYGIDYRVRVVAVGDTVAMYVDDVLRNTYTLTAGEVTTFTAAGFTKIGLRGATQTRYDTISAFAA